MAEGIQVPRIEELANGHEPFISATKAARIYKVNYWQLVLAVRLGQITGVEFALKERGKGLALLVPVSQAQAWAEQRHAVVDERAAKRAEKQAEREAKVARRADTTKARQGARDAHMAMMREALAVKRAAGGIKSRRVTITRAQIAAQAQLNETHPAGDQAVEDSLKSLSKREVYAILTALERLAQVHAERAAKDKG